MTRQRAFETAASRRRRDPIVWIIDGVQVRLRASVDMIEMGEILERLKDEKPAGMSDIAWTADRRRVLEEVLLGFIEPESHEGWETVLPDIDFPMMNEMLSDLIEEYTGQANPTQAQSSSGGSSLTGGGSMAGAPLEA
jgi:hypothetical protein